MNNWARLNGSVSKVGIRKVKPKILPPMAKRDTAGNLITEVAPLKQLYLQTYIHRLRDREIRDELTDLFQLKTQPWAERSAQCSENISREWFMNDLDKVLKSLKNNQSRDPNDMINALLKPETIGRYLKVSLLS